MPESRQKAIIGKPGGLWDVLSNRNGLYGINIEIATSVLNSKPFEAE